MNKFVIAAALLLGLTACGGGAGTTPEDDGTYPYNPAPSAVESSDSRVPYYGDWVWAARLPDGNYQLGILRVDTRGTETSQSKNGGVGRGGLCDDANCAVPKETSYGVINTLVKDGRTELVAVFGDARVTQTQNRLAIMDSDAALGTNGQNNAVVAGVGTWTGASGREEQTVRAAFVQVDADPKDNVFSTPAAFEQAKAAADAVVTSQRLDSSTFRDSLRMVPAPH